MARNPYINKYKRHLVKRENKRQQANRIDQIAKVGTAVAAGVGVLAGTHALHSKGLYGALGDAGRAIQSATQATRQLDIGRRVRKEFGNWLDEEPINIRTHLDELDRTFKETYEKTHAELSFESRRMQFEEAINRGLGEARGAGYSRRRDKVHQSVMGEMDDFIDRADDYTARQMKKLKRDVQHKVAPMANMHYRNQSTRLNAQLSNLKDDYDDELVDQFSSMLKDKSRKIDVSERFQKEVRDNLEDITYKDVARSRSKDQGFFKETMDNLLGYKRVTGREMLDMKRSGEVKNMHERALAELENLERRGFDLDEFYVDDNLYLHKGKLVDTKGFASVKNAIGDTFSEGLLGKILLSQDRKHFREFGDKRPIKILRAGRYQHILKDLDVTDEDGVLKESLVGVNNKVYKLTDLENPLKEGLEFTSGKFGTTQRLLHKMSGVNIPDEEDMKWWESKTLDISRKEDPSFWDKFKSTLTKEAHEKWTPTQIEKAFSNKESVTHSDIYNIQEYLKSHAQPFSDNVLQHLSQDVVSKHDKIDSLNLGFDTEGEIIRSFDEILNKWENDNINSIFKDKSEIEHAFRNNLQGLIDRTRIVQHPQYLKQNEVVTGTDMIKGEIGKFLMEQQGGGMKTLESLKKLYDEGKITLDKFEQGKTSVAKYIVDELHLSGTTKFGRQPDKINAFSKLFDGASKDKKAQEFQSIVKDMSKRTHPWFSKGPVDGFDGMFKDDVIAINKVDTDRMMSGDLGYIGNVIKGMFTHGRDDVSEVNTWDVRAYSVPARLNELLGDFSLLPLSLSDRSGGSTGSLVKNFYTKRILPAYGIYQGAKYINDYSDRITGGQTLKQRYHRTKAKTRLQASRLKDMTKVTGGLKWLDSVTPGSENFATLMGDVPVAGWMADWTGAMSSKSRDEWVEYYKHGKKAVREGRFWPLGNQPWMGQGVDHYEPNEYKQAMAEWEYTSTVYGSKDKYWEHSFFPNHTMLPTLEDPLRPFKRFNTYWWEQMHKKDRPYPLSGELFDPNTPHGAVLNATVGQVLKPSIDYGAGASKSDLRKQKSKAQKQSHLVAQYKGGRVQFNRFIPKASVTKDTSYLRAMAQGQTGQVARNIAGEQESIKAKARSGSAQGVIGTSDGLARGKIKSQQDIYSINQSLKAQAQKGRYNAKDESKALLREINESFKSKAKAIEMESKKREKAAYMVKYVPEMTRTERDVEAQDPRNPIYKAKKMGYLAQDILGARGFLLGMPFGNAHGEGQKVIEKADNAYATSNRFWEMTPGGRGGSLSELARRILNHPRNRMQRVNHRPNMMPNWLPGDEYFKNFQEGDPYTKIKRGEIRLPGEAYETMHKVHPDKYGKYGAVDRAAILADVAPYSKQYQFWKGVAQSQKLTKEEKDFLQRAKERSKEQKKDYFITPYQFKGELNEKQAKIKKFVGPNRFKVEGSDEIYRLSGVSQHLNLDGKTDTSKKIINVLQKNMYPGTEVTLMTEPGAQNEQGSIPAVIRKGNKNVNRALISSGAETKKENSLIGSYAKHSAIGRTVGRAWESLSHAPIPYVHNKAFAAESPVEHLKRKNLYGKSYQNWNEPVEDFVEPAYQSAIAKSPVWAGIGFGAFVGTFGMMFASPRHFKKLFTAGAMVGGSSALWRQSYENRTGKAWIPERREEQREINEYFDKIKYLKYKRLYNKYKELAKVEDDVDLDKIMNRLKDKKEKIKNQKYKLRNWKENATKSTGKVVRFKNKEGRLQYALEGSKELAAYKSKQVNKKIKELEEKEVLMNLGPYSRKAIKYREKYKSTLFAVDENVNYTRVYRALPDKDKDYFKYFAQETNPEKREEILKLVSKEQARMYKAIWGKDIESHDIKDLEKYFDKHQLPEETWVGWKEGIDLEDAKIKVIENENLNLDDFGIWKDYTEDERLTPAPTKPGVPFDKRTPNVNARLRAVLEQYDIEDLEIEVTPKKGKKVELNMDIDFDIKDKIKDGIEKLLAN
jgi:hypothetical protein